jgi:hypothetical protein
MRTRIKKLLNIFIGFLPVQIVRIILERLNKKLANNHNNWNKFNRLDYYLWVQIRTWPIIKINRLGKLVNRYQLININDLPSVKELKRIKSGSFINFLPKVHGICAGGEIKYDFEDEIFYQMSDVSFNIESDFIRKDSLVVCEKLIRKDANILLVEDFDFIAKHKADIYLIERKKKIYLDNVFYITGVLSNFWSHFLICFYPRLAYLNQSNVEEISIVVPYNIDSNIKQLITESFGNQLRVLIVEVDYNTTVVCKNLFFAKINSYILCHSNHGGPYGIQISKLTTQFLYRKFSKVSPSRERPLRKLFIARSGVRNIQNYREVFSYFESLGFEEVVPHKLSIEQKIKVFGEAKIIVGPFSSGFTNIVFCKPGVQIFAFTNYARCYDSYVSTLSKVWDAELTLITGTDVDATINSNYTINISDVDYCFKDKFLG